MCSSLEGHYLTTIEVCAFVWVKDEGGLGKSSEKHLAPGYISSCLLSWAIFSMEASRILWACGISIPFSIIISTDLGA